MTPLAILYVDDDPDIRTIVTLALSLDPDITLTTAGSGTEALSLLHQGLTPDIAVLDVMMPEMNGLLLLKHLQDDPRTTRLPVIFMTAKARDADLSEYHDLGAAGVIVKPFDPLTLASQIRDLKDAHASADQGWSTRD